MSSNNTPEERTKFETYFRKYNGWTFARDEGGDYTEIAIELAFEAWTAQSCHIYELEQQVKDQTRARLMVDAELSRVRKDRDAMIAGWESIHGNKTIEQVRTELPTVTDTDDIMNLQVPELETIVGFPDRIDLASLETRESRVSYPCANGCGNGVGTLGALCMSCERFIEKNNG